MSQNSDVLTSGYFFSDPEGLELGNPHSASGAAAPGGAQVGGGFSHPYNRHRRDDVTLARRGVSNDSNLLRPSSR